VGETLVQAQFKVDSSELSLFSTLFSLSHSRIFSEICVCMHNFGTASSR